MTIHKKGQAHWEGDIKRGKGQYQQKAAPLTNNRMALIHVLKARRVPTRKS